MLGSLLGGLGLRVVAGILSVLWKRVVEVHAVFLMPVHGEAVESIAGRKGGGLCLSSKGLNWVTYYLLVLQSPLRRTDNTRRQPPHPIQSQQFPKPA